MIVNVYHDAVATTEAQSQEAQSGQAQSEKAQSEKAQSQGAGRKRTDIAFLVAQKKFIATMTFSGLKG